MFSHNPNPNILKYRKYLNTVDLKDGLKYSIDVLEDTGIFWGQRSWIQSSQGNSNLKIFRYESLANDNKVFLKSL